MQQRQQHDDGFLLIPRDVERQRQLVDIVETERLLQGHRDEREAVGVVALAGIEHAGNTADIAERQLDVLVLRTAGREDDRVLRQCLGELRVVLAALHAAIAAGHDHELLDGAGLHGLDDLVGQCEHLGMCEAADDLALLQLRRSRAFLRQLDDGGEILRAIGFERDVLAAGYADCARCEQAVFVAVFRRHDTVRRHEDRAVELLELILLLPPGVAVVACEVLVLLELRIVVRRQHLAVGVDIDARALRLLQQHLEVLEVVAGNQDARVLAHAEVHLRELRITIRLRVGSIQEGHAVHAPLARLQREGDEVVHRQTVIEQLRERGLQESIDGLVLMVEHVRMLHVGSEPLQAVGDELAQAADILVLRGEHADFIRCRLGCEAIARIVPERSLRQVRAVLQLREQLLLD